MKHLFLCLVFTVTATFSQSETQLKYQLKKELQLMEAQGATSFEISQKFFPQDRTKYVMNLKEFIGLQLLSEYMSNLILERKISEGTLGEDLDASPKTLSDKYKTYQDYLDYKKTPEAIEQWESNIDDGILKLVVTDINNFNQNDKKRYSDLKGLFDRDPFFTSFIITDSVKSKTITRE